MTLVSVIIPTYNRNELLIGRSLTSVLRQSHSRLDIHIVADGMVDPEWDELERQVSGLRDQRITLWNIPRQTYPDNPGEKWCVLGLNARNIGLDNAVGEWIAPLDDDDEWTNDHVEVLLRAVEKAKSDFAYGQSKYHWPDGRLQFAGKWPPGMGAFCDGAQLYRNGMGYRYDPGCIDRGLPEDGDLWIRMREGGVLFTYVPQVVHHYYPNPRW